MDVAGLENIPSEGPLILAPNHLHVFDLPVDFVVIPRRPTLFAADKWRNKVGGWIMKLMANTVFVARGEADREALTKAMAVLKAGGTLAIAPEGTRSRTGGLLPGKNGTVYLASRSGVPILPMVSWGHEHALGAWAHLRRPDIHVRIAPPIVLPPEARRAKGEELDKYTDELMLTLARMLPPEYRGAYSARFPAEPG
jgi:1-acyl-sn-glycerol-3-phosphate acyltransferase